MTHPRIGAATVGLITLVGAVFTPSLAEGAEPAVPSTDEPPLPALPPPAPPPSVPSPPPAASASKPLVLTIPKAKPRGRGVWRSFRAGAELVSSVPTAAIIDGAWSISLHINTELTNRTWDAPYPYGTLGQYSTRILYGLSWTLMLGLESLAVVVASQGKFDWLGEASFRSDWVVPIDLPSCPYVGAWGGCGLGVGTFSFLQVRPLGTKWWFEAGGGWIQQRVLNDALRTVAESSWVLTPISALREFKTNPDDEVAFRLFAGPGIYFGMHNGHMHPTRRGAEIYRDVPWTEMYPLDAGIGPGVRAEGRLSIKHHLVLEGEMIMAPFIAGGPSRRVSPDIAPLDFEREGVSVWRKVGLGIGWDDPRHLPFKATLAFFGAELSERPVERIGYRGVMLRFDIPLKVPREE